VSDSEAEPEGALAPSAQGGARWRVGLGAAVVLLVLGVAVAVVAGLVSGGGAAEPVAELTPTSGAAVTPGSPAPTAAASVVIHVLGQVKRPGVYELSVGARAIDAIGAAGGFTAGADQSALNLAQVLVDGQQVLVPRPGEAPPASAAGAGAPASGTPAPGAEVDLNTATLEQLETLPRVGPAMAQRIIDWRTQNGGFSSVDDLNNVSGIGDKTFAELKDLVVVR
jgi:competence protein ComEA